MFAMAYPSLLFVVVQSKTSYISMLKFKLIPLLAIPTFMCPAIISGVSS